LRIWQTSLSDSQSKKDCIDVEYRRALSSNTFATCQTEECVSTQECVHLFKSSALFSVMDRIGWSPSPSTLLGYSNTLLHEFNSSQTFKIYLLSTVNEFQMNCRLRVIGLWLGVVSRAELIQCPPGQ